MTSSGGSSGGSSSSGGGGGGGGNPLVYDRTTGNWVEPTQSELKSSVANKSVAPMPVAQSAAPRGAFLGTTSSGTSMTSNGDGTSSVGSENVSLPKATSYESQPNQINYVQATSGAGRNGLAPPSGTAQLLYPSEGGGGAGKGRDGGGEVGTSINQQPAAGGSGASGGGPVGTTITSGPRSDFSVVLAGQVGKRPDRSPSRSNNFVSLIGGAGGLGRKGQEAKRTLIGGA